MFQTKANSGVSRNGGTPGTAVSGTCDETTLIDTFRRRFRIAAVPGIAAVLLSFVVSAQAATYYVSPSGNDSNPGAQASPWRTIQKAANTLAAGDTALIRGGTYAEHVVVPKSGTAGNLITYQNYPSETPIIDGTGLGLGRYAGLFEIGSHSYITVHGLTLQNSGGYGLSVGNGDHLIIEDNRIHDTGVGTTSNGILCDGKTGSGPTIIRRNTIYNTTAGGIAIWTNNPGGYFLIEDNIIHDFTGIGNYDGIQGGDISYAVIRGNTVYGKSGSEGDYIDWGGNQTGTPHHAVIEGNLVYRSPGGPGTLTSTYPISNVNFKWNNQPKDFIVRNNVLEEIVMALYERPDTRVAVYNNTSVSAYYAIQFWNGDQGPGTEWSNPSGTFVFKNNLLTFATHELLIHQGTANASGAAPNIIFDHNVYRFDGGGISWYSKDGAHSYDAQTPGASGLAAYNLWRSQMGHETSGGTRTEQSPAQLFVNSAARDLHLASGSAAIDAGKALTFAVGAGTNSTQLKPNEWWYFIGDWAASLGVAPDSIKVGNNNPVAIASINEGTGVITLASPISWNNNDPIYLGNYNGSAPDAGAFESGGTTPPPSGSACDVNNDGGTNVSDVQLCVNQAIAVSPCTADINQDGSCNVVDVQRVVNAALGGQCVSN